MFQKIDPKIKYQNLAFKKRLQKAKNFKRSVRRFPETKWQIFLARCGLNSLTSKLVVFACFVVLIYTIYIPNFLEFKQIILEGSALNNKTEILSTVNSYLNSRHFWPQRNLLLLSKKGLADYLTKNNDSILRVTNVKRTFPNTLTIKIDPRLEQFLVTAGQAKFIVSNDGLVLKKISPQDLTGTSTLYSNLIKINLSTDKDYGLYQNIASEDWLNEVKDIKNGLTKQIGSTPADFKITDFNDPDLIANMPAGYKILFDASSDMLQELNEYKVVWNNLSLDQKNRLYYIDLRIKNRGYVCYKNTECAKETIINPATTTPNNLLE